MVNYIKLTNTTIIVCISLFAGCARAQYAVKKSQLAPAGLPGMGGEARENAQDQPASADLKKAVKQNNAALPGTNLDIISRDMFNITISTKQPENDVTLSFAPGSAPGKPAKSKKQKPAEKTAPKPPADNFATAPAGEQPAIAKPEEKQVLLPPTPEEIRELSAEDKPAQEAAVKQKNISETATVAPVAEETYAEEKVTVQVKPEVKPEAMTTETVPAAPQSGQRLVNESSNEKKSVKAVPAEDRAGENKAGETTKLSAAQRQQAARKKFKEKEERKKQRQKLEQAKHPARMHTVAAGENLSSLAEKYYGDKNLWWKIYDANKDKIDKGSLRVEQLILIP